MPLFTPPTTEGVQRYDLTDVGPARELFKFYGGNVDGNAVWKDEQGEWQQSPYPYAGKQVTTAFYNGEIIASSGPDSGVETGNPVYMGGHDYEITDAEATELTNAGYGAYINTQPLERSAWTDEDVPRWTDEVFSQHADMAFTTPFAEAGRMVFPATGTGNEGTSSHRSIHWHDYMTGWTDVYAKIVLDPYHYAVDLGFGLILPQQGAALRFTNDAGDKRVVAINNNVFLAAPNLNIGVWRNNNGIFGNRQVSLAGLGGKPFPHTYEINLVGSVAKVRGYHSTDTPSSYDDPAFATEVDLDNFGDTVGIPTPVGEGACGYLTAHPGTNVLGSPRLGPATFVRLL